MVQSTEHSSRPVVDRFVRSVTAPVALNTRDGASARGIRVVRDGVFGLLAWCELVRDHRLLFVTAPGCIVHEFLLCRVNRQSNTHRAARLPPLTRFYPHRSGYRDN